MVFFVGEIMMETNYHVKLFGGIRRSVTFNRGQDVRGKTIKVFVKQRNVLADIVSEMITLCATCITCHDFS